MSFHYEPSNTITNPHSWLKQAKVCFNPGEGITPLVEKVVSDFLDHLQPFGHIIQSIPDNSTSIILTTAPFGKPISWRRSLRLTGRALYNLENSPSVFTMIHAHPDELDEKLDLFARLLEKDEPDQRVIPSMD